MKKPTLIQVFVIIISVLMLSLLREGLQIRETIWQFELGGLSITFWDGASAWCIWFLGYVTGLIVK